MRGAQVAQLSARVQQLTAHLQTHRKDFACRRGLVILLGQRRRLMQYLYKVNRCAHTPEPPHAHRGRLYITGSRDFQWVWASAHVQAPYGNLII